MANVAPRPPAVHDEPPVRFPECVQDLYPPPSPFALVRIDGRRGPVGERYRGMTFPSADDAQTYLDALPERTRVALDLAGFRILRSVAVAAQGGAR